MSEEEKEAIAHLEWLLDSGILASEDEPHVETVLNLIQTQKAEIKKKDKIIDAMANEIYIEITKPDGNHFNTVEEVKEYFENLVKEKE